MGFQIPTLPELDLNQSVGSVGSENLLDLRLTDSESESDAVSVQNTDNVDSEHVSRSLENPEDVSQVFIDGNMSTDAEEGSGPVVSSLDNSSALGSVIPDVVESISDEGNPDRETVLSSLDEITPDTSASSNKGLSVAEEGASAGMDDSISVDQDDSEVTEDTPSPFPVPAPHRSVRQRRPPAWMDGAVYNFQQSSTDSSDRNTDRLEKLMFLKKVFDLF